MKYMRDGVAMIEVEPFRYVNAEYLKRKSETVKKDDGKLTPEEWADLIGVGK